MELKVLQTKIHEIRGSKVMLDFDLAILYEVETRTLNQTVKRNSMRFPIDFMFQLDKEEFENLKSQIVTSSWGGSRKLPHAFTEQGIAMLSGLINSEKAIKINIAIMRAFVEIRKMLSYQSGVSTQINELKNELELRLGEQDEQIIEIYNTLDSLLDKNEEEKYWNNRNKIGYK